MTKTEAENCILAAYSLAFDKKPGKLAKHIAALSAARMASGEGFRWDKLQNGLEALVFVKPEPVPA